MRWYVNYEPIETPYGRLYAIKKTHEPKHIDSKLEDTLVRGIHLEESIEPKYLLDLSASDRDILIELSYRIFIRSIELREVYEEGVPISRLVNDVFFLSCMSVRSLVFLSVVLPGGLSGL